MNRRRHERSEVRLHEPSAIDAHAEFRTDERLRCGGTEADDDARFDDADLGVEPGTAGGDLRAVRLFVNPALAAWLPLEVLHDVRDVDLRTIDACFVQGLVEKSTRRPHERPSFEVLRVARLFANEHYDRVL